MPDRADTFTSAPTAATIRPFTGAGMTGGIAKGNYAGNWGFGTWNPIATSTSYVGTNGGMFDVVALPFTSSGETNKPVAASSALDSASEPTTCSTASIEYDDD